LFPGPGPLKSKTGGGHLGKYDPSIVNKRHSSGESCEPREEAKMHGPSGKWSNESDKKDGDGKKKLKGKNPPYAKSKG